MTDLNALLSDAVQRLQAPIAEYYDAVENVDMATPHGQAVRVRAAVQAREGFRRAISQMFDAVALLASDGNLESAVRARLAALKAEQYAYATDFIGALPDLSRAAALARAALYAGAAERAYSRLATVYVPTLSQYPGDGQTECDWHCQCRLKVIKVGARDYDIYWVVDAEAEHCDDCIRLSREWNPLEVRGGVIQTGKRLSPVELAHLKTLFALALDQYPAPLR